MKHAAARRPVTRSPDNRGLLRHRPDPPRPPPAPRRAVSRRPDLRGLLVPRRARVGRSQPDDEIALLDKSIEQLRADVAGYEPPPDRPDQVTTWASIVQALNLYVLRWGQFKTALADDYWWGDDDETVFSSLRNQYNALRQQVLAETKVRVTAPEVETPADLDPDPPEKPPTDLTVKELAVYALAGTLVIAVGYAVIEWKFGHLLRAARRAAASSNGGG